MKEIERILQLIEHLLLGKTGSRLEREEVLSLEDVSQLLVHSVRSLYFSLILEFGTHMPNLEGILNFRLVIDSNSFPS